ncbi:hypothetical protein EHM76_02155 [bacterium]|nr:MAG: hypothetical protein EHM76_02155 [bacterium]
MKKKDPKDTLMGINPKAAVPKWIEGGGLQRTFNPTPSTPFQRDVANVENTVRGGIRKGATAVGDALTGASDALGTGISTGMRAIGDYFGGPIKPEAPPPVVAPVAAPKTFPAAAAPLVAPAAQPPGMAGKKTQADFMKDIADTREPTKQPPGLSTTSTEQPVSPNYIESGGIRYPVARSKPEDQMSDIDAELNKMVDDLMGKAKFTDPHGRTGYNPQLMGMAKEIKTAQIQGKYGMAGRQATEEASALQGAENRKVDRERIAADKERLTFEMNKFNETSDIKDPINFMKFAGSIAKQTVLGDDGMTTYETQDPLAGAQILVDTFGPSILPKGITLPQKVKMVQVKDKNGRSGRIPESNLAAALKAGYTQVK